MEAPYYVVMRHYNVIIVLSSPFLQLEGIVVLRSKLPMPLVYWISR